jgi:cellulose synthase/poly-beta-1,6-N-acetylglucosamine synthase-like glycosyltransferase
MKVSIVIPVRNAGDILAQCLDSLRFLDYSHYEVLLVDGMSTDNTRNIAQQYNVRVIDNPKHTVVSARNIGFAQSVGELVAFTDADCVVDTDWLKNAVKYFEDEKVGGIGGANLIPKEEKPFAKAVGIIFDMAHGLNSGAPTKVLDKVIESRFFGSNAIYRSSVLSKVLPIDESIREGEDVVLNYKITELGYKLLYVPDVLVWHYRRATPKSFWNQMYRYGLAKVLLSKSVPKSVTFPQILLGFSLPILIIILIAGLFNFVTAYSIYGIFAVLIILIAFLYGSEKSQSSTIGINFLWALLILPFAWSAGYLRELVRRRV